MNTTERITVRVPTPVVHALESIAEHEDRKLSYVVNRALREWLDENAGAPKGAPAKGHADLDRCARISCGDLRGASTHLRMKHGKHGPAKFCGTRDCHVFQEPAKGARRRG